MNLYLLSTQGLGDFYVVSESPNDAIAHLNKLLDIADYGFTDRRKVINTKLLSEEVYEFSDTGRPFFSSGNRLILPETCKNCKIKD